MNQRPQILFQKSTYEGTFFVVLLVLSRLFLLFSIGYFFNGKNFSSDTKMLISLANEPMGILLGTSIHGQHPPLLGLFLSIFYIPIKLFFSDFYAFRLTLIIYEALSLFFLWKALLIVFQSVKNRIKIIMGFIFFPAGWITTVFMPQDEIVAMFYISVVLWLLFSNRYLWAILICSLGVVGAKIFLIIPLAGLILTIQERKLLTKILIGAMPIVIVYTVMLLLSINQDSATVMSFAPKAMFGINLWVLIFETFNLTSTDCRNYSSILALIGGLIPAILLWIRFKAITKEEYFNNHENSRATIMITMMSAMLLLVFSLFYHINPEYYTMILPLLLLSFKSGYLFYGIGIMVSAAWATNFFYGVNFAISTGIQNSSKSFFVKAYDAIFPFEPSFWHHFSLITCSLITIYYSYYAIMMIIDYTKKTPGPAADF
ncbi:MAG: hypothetical protein D6B27_02375 [Gammaproteobacteria bacterium]|nr:MAG: hypothetical protein D6B27_02375 [Gammaproteobacteria bacterium]